MSDLRDKIAALWSDCCWQCDEEATAKAADVMAVLEEEGTLESRCSCGSTLHREDHRRFSVLVVPWEEDNPTHKAIEQLRDSMTTGPITGGFIADPNRCRHGEEDPDGPA